MLLAIYAVFSKKSGHWIIPNCSQLKNFLFRWVLIQIYIPQIAFFRLSFLWVTDLIWAAPSSNKRLERSESGFRLYVLFLLEKIAQCCEIYVLFPRLPALLVSCLPPSLLSPPGTSGFPTLCSPLLFRADGVIIVNHQINTVLLGRVVYEILKMQSDKTSALERMGQGTKACVVLFPLLGMTWVFGVLSVTEAGLAFQYIFTILNSLQVQ